MTRDRGRPNARRGQTSWWLPLTMRVSGGWAGGPGRAICRRGLLIKLTAGGARVVVNTLPLGEPEDARGLDEIRKLARISETDAYLGVHPQLTEQLRRSAAALDTDTQLAQALTRNGRTLVRAQPLPGAARAAVPASLVTSRTWADTLSTVPAVKDFRWPLTPLLKAAAGVGHGEARADHDDVVRTHDLVLTGAGRVVPSLVLAAATLAQQRSPVVQLPLTVAPQEITVGSLSMPTDGPARLRPQFYPSLAHGRAAGFSVPAHEVLSGALPASIFKDKVVFLGAVTPAVGPAAFLSLDTPVQRGMPQVEVLAHSTLSVLAGHSIRSPLWADGLTALASLLALALLWWVMPRWSAMPRTIVTVVAAVVPMAIAHTALSRHGVWVPMALPMLLMLAGYAAIGVFELLRKAAGHVQTVQQHDAALSNALQKLVTELEDQGQTQAAATVAVQAARLKPRDVSLGARADELQRQATQPAPLDVLTTQRTLGRYLLDEEIGRGAMGAIYSAHDPKIGRTVAIKTMALGAEFEGTALSEARERFFHEAETAGRLQHPDIVTIFDAGEESGLAYIAMELLRGRDLGEHVHPSARLPVPQLLYIMARVADALAYAHRQGVVHRDVKPANIVVQPERDLVKVTDFGIARVTDATRTRTGSVLGTPSFMSPEQLAGHLVDGRSDLYSLGVTLFQLLTGVLPFRSESMVDFMQAVTQQRAPGCAVTAPRTAGGAVQCDRACPGEAGRNPVRRRTPDGR